MDGIGKLVIGRWVAPLTAPQHQRGRGDPASTADEGYDHTTYRARRGPDAVLDFLDARIAAVIGVVEA
jgi:hypothetical protein